VDKTSGGTVTRTVTYYPIAGAMRINSTLYYILKDHLGSASVVTDASGNILGENRYYPFGETRLTTGSILTEKLFTGQREMAGLGVYHYGARFYSPKTGRFLSADMIVQSYANPQSLNRYSYVLGNPLKYTDPTGHTVACDPMEDDCHDDDSGGNNNNNNNNDGGGNDPTDPTEDADDPNPGGIVLDNTTTPTCSSYMCNPNMPPAGYSMPDIPGQCDWPHCLDEREYIHPRSDWLLPDYLTVNFAIPVIAELPLAGVDIQITLDYYGNLYVAGGGFVGILGYSVFGGDILQTERPEPSQLNSFLTGISVFGGGGIGIGGGVNWGAPFHAPPQLNDFAGEVCYTTPGGVAGITYGFSLVNLKNIFTGNP